MLGDTYRQEITDAPGIQLVLHANVTSIVLDDSGNSVDHVEVKTLTGNAFTARAPLFVLATGGLEVPRLLLASNDRRPAGLGNDNDLVGRCFMEHLNIASGPVALTVGDDALAPYVLNATTVDVGGEARRLLVAERCARRSRRDEAQGAAGVRAHARVPLRRRRSQARADLSGVHERSRPDARRKG